MAIGELVYILCAVTSLACAVLLVRAYLANRTSLLLFSSLFFIGFFLNSVLLVVDLVVMPTGPDLLLARDVTNTASIMLLVIGLVWSSRP